jgi:hypothetical protein
MQYLTEHEIPQSNTRRLFFRYFINNSGWTLPALFSILRDLRDLAFDVNTRLVLIRIPAYRH